MKNKTAYIFLTPAILFLLAFAVIPVVQVFYFSFTSYNIFEEAVFNGFDNYIRLFNDSRFLYALLNSFLFVLVTPVIIFISLSLALILRENSNTNKIIRSLFFLPVITPIVIAGIFWRWIFTEDTGIMNYILSMFGFSPVQWLTGYPQNLFSVMILTVWRGFGYYMMIFLAALTVLPKEVEEAAEIDGAGRLQKIFYIIIPSIKNTLVLVFVLSGAAAVKIFTELYIMIPGAPASNKTLVYYMYKHAFERFDFGYGSAAGIIIFLLTMGFSYMNIKLLEGSDEKS